MQHVTVIDEYQHRNVESYDQSQDSNNVIHIMHLYNYKNPHR